MKNIFQILFFLSLSLIAFAQGKKESTEQVKWDFHPKVFISGGINKVQYNSDVFFKYQFDNTNSSAPLYFSNTATVFSGSTVPEKFDHVKLSTSTSINIGLEINSDTFKNYRLNHVFEASCLRILGNYSYHVSYEELDGFDSWYVKDTNRIQFTQTVLALGYKIQPTYKCIFFSLGIHFSVGLIKTDQQKTEQIDAWYFNEFTMQNVHAYTKNTENSSTYHFHLINAPFQAGVGGNIKIKSIILKPGFYFTPVFLKGYESYNFYSFSIGVLFGLKKHK